ncbi:Oxidored-FMN domain-containing protein [Mycena indigotica]|uniref:Oxidored-FMN domain-containing protein n=1 Tax=Mycena indigotica TaxID=2126181 RepID=A0A8H6SGK8_9AGAR|nr:Oxidored-FMN domain-containing protein [Mycena indigotica]KAF7298568.1 Oxidored-FMN domain-containing protein [Mycena indigotica]
MAQANILFTSLRLGSTTIPNRIGMSAMTRNRAAKGSIPTELMQEYYVQRATSGVGFIVSEQVAISSQGSQWEDLPGMWTDEQLGHSGRTSHPDAALQKASGEPVYGPSAIAARGGKFRFLPGEPGYVVPTPIPNPRTIIAQYKHAALNAKRAGFDGVELHAASGLLISQFLDSKANQRTDEWGGSPVNRVRFALETLDALREVWGKDVSLKISPANGTNDVGMPLEETIATFGYLLKEVDTRGLAYVSIVRYNAQKDAVYDGKPRGTPHDVLATYAPFLSNTNLFANGGVTPTEAVSLLSATEPRVDGVFFGAPFIAHPDLPQRISQGKPLDNALKFAYLYDKLEEDWTVGYTDYPRAI